MTPLVVTTMYCTWMCNDCKCNYKNNEEERQINRKP